MDLIERGKYLSQLDKQWFATDILGVDYKPHRGEMSFICFYHNDKHASCNVNVFDNGLFHCPACGAGGDFIQLICDKKGIKFREALKLIRKEVDIPVNINSKNFNVYDKKFKSELTSIKPYEWQTARNIMKSNSGFRTAVNKYGISNEVIDRFQLGIMPGDILRLIIPIFVGDKLVSVKKHRISGNPSVKTLSQTGSHVSLYSYNDMIAKDKLLLLEGEPDMLTAYSYGVDSFITPCCQTGGSGTFLDEWIDMFSSKDVYICYDNDEAGRTGAKKVKDKLSGSANSVRIISLPNNCKDIREFFVNLNNSLFGLKELFN